MLPALLMLAPSAHAVVIRSDVADARYRIPASAFPALADMPGEGHGVLIAPQWVVTAAHAAPMEGMDESVTINGVAYKVARVIKYPGYQRLPDALAKEGLVSGDWTKVHRFLAASDDIALIKLASPVKEVVPVALYRGDDEIGKTVELIGKGATGNGTKGQPPHAPHRGILRHAFNVVTGADSRYIWYRFDAPPAGLPLEGISGSGDSGGPVLIADRGQKQLAGLNSWIKDDNSHVTTPGLYGQLVFTVRISQYIKWIEGVMSANATASASKQAR